MTVFLEYLKDMFTLRQSAMILLQNCISCLSLCKPVTTYGLNFSRYLASKNLNSLPPDNVRSEST